MAATKAARDAAMEAAHARVAAAQADIAAATRQNDEARDSAARFASVTCATAHPPAARGDTTARVLRGRLPTAARVQGRKAGAAPAGDGVQGGLRDGGRGAGASRRAQ